MSAEWVFNRDGKAVVILDIDCFRNNRGQVIAWTSRGSVYKINGHHAGWFDNGVLYDSRNSALGFIRNYSSSLPSVPGLGGTPGMPGFTGKPGRPGFSGAPGRPGKGAWSSEDLENYFSL